MSGWATASATTVEPGVELVVAAAADLDAGRRDALRLARERAAQHVLERLEPVAAVGEQGADRGVGEVRELDLDRGAAGGEGPLDLVELGRVRDAVEAEPGDLVERRVRLGEARDPAGDGDQEAAPRRRGGGPRWRPRR